MLVRACLCCDFEATNRFSTSIAERRVIAGSPLFKEAQQRLTDLQRKDANKFSPSVQQAQDRLSFEPRLLKIERG